jgi:short-subunit dehydrogenase
MKEKELAYALITGASSGIGAELARVFARQGHPLILLARDKRRLDLLADELRREFGARVEVLPQDLAAERAARNVAARLARKKLRVDILVNNAGFDVYGNFTETDWAQERRMIQVNLIALTELCKLLAAGMKQRGGGRILNVGSTGSFIPCPLNTVYAATKAYVLSFSEALAEELRGSGVTVTALCPGATRTEFQPRAGISGIPLMRFGMMDAKPVAETGYRALMSGRRIAVPGVLNQVQVFMTRLLPRSILTRASKAMLKQS